MGEGVMIKDGGPAFPALHSIDGNWVKDPRPEYAGMSLRDYFAGQALVGVCASVSSREQVFALYNDARKHGVETEEYIAKASYALADALLAEREKSC